MSRIVLEISADTATLARLEKFQSEIAALLEGSAVTSASNISRRLQQAEVSFRSATAAAEQYKKTVATLSATEAANTAATRQSTLARDTHTGATERAIAGEKAWHSALRGTSGALGLLWTTYGQILPLMTAYLTVATAIKGINTASDFEYATKFAYTLANATGNASLSLADLRQRLLDIQDTVHTPQELADATKELVKAGFSASQAVGDMATMSKMAAVAEEDLALTTKAVASQYRAWNAEVVGAERGVTSLTEVANMMTFAAMRSAMGIGDLMQMVKHTGTLARNSGIEFSELLAALGHLTNMGITGTTAATSLTTALLKIQNPTSKATEEMRRLGVSFDFIDAATGQVKNLTGVFGLLQSELAKLPTKERLQLISDIFTIRSMKAGPEVIQSINKAVVEGTLSITDFAAAIEEAGKKGEFLNQVYAELGETTKIALDRLKADFARELAKSFETAPVRELIEELRASLKDGSLSAFIGGLATIVKGVVEWRHELVLLGEAWILGKGVETLLAISSALWKVVGAQTAWNAASAANPYFIVGAGLVAMNEGLKSWNLDIMSLARSSQDFAESAQKIGEVLSGVRDASTGELLTDADILQRRISALKDEISAAEAPDKPWYLFSVFPDTQAAADNLRNLKAALAEAQGQLSAIRQQKGAQFVDFLSEEYSYTLTPTAPRPGSAGDGGSAERALQSDLLTLTADRLKRETELHQVEYRARTELLQAMYQQNLVSTSDYYAQVEEIAVETAANKLRVATAEFEKLKALEDEAREKSKLASTGDNEKVKDDLEKATKARLDAEAKVTAAAEELNQAYVKNYADRNQRVLDITRQTADQQIAELRASERVRQTEESALNSLALSKLKGDYERRLITEREYWAKSRLLQKQALQAKIAELEVEFDAVEREIANLYNLESKDGELKPGTQAKVDALELKLKQIIADLEAAGVNVRAFDEDTATGFERMRREADKTSAMFEEIGSDIRGAFKDTFREMLDEGAGAFDNFGDRLLSIFKDMLAEMATLALAAPIIVPIVQGAGSILGIGSAEQQQLLIKLGMGSLAGLAGSGFSNLLNPKTLALPFVGDAAAWVGQSMMEAGFTDIGATIADLALSDAALGGMTAGLGTLAMSLLSGEGLTAQSGLKALGAGVGAAFLGPIGAIGGGMLGDFVGDLFGDDDYWNTLDVSGSGKWSPEHGLVMPSGAGLAPVSAALNAQITEQLAALPATVVGDVVANLKLSSIDYAWSGRLENQSAAAVLQQYGQVMSGRVQEALTNSAVDAFVDSAADMDGVLAAEVEEKMRGVVSANGLAGATEYFNTLTGFVAGLHNTIEPGRMDSLIDRLRTLNAVYEQQALAAQQLGVSTDLVAEAKAASLPQLLGLSKESTVQDFASVFAEVSEVFGQLYDAKAMAETAYGDSLSASVEQNAWWALKKETQMDVAPRDLFSWMPMSTWNAFDLDVYSKYQELRPEALGLSADELSSRYDEARTASSTASGDYHSLFDDLKELRDAAPQFAVGLTQAINDWLAPAESETASVAEAVEAVTSLRARFVELAEVAETSPAETLASLYEGFELFKDASNLEQTAADLRTAAAAMDEFHAAIVADVRAPLDAVIDLHNRSDFQRAIDELGDWYGAQIEQAEAYRAAMAEADYTSWLDDIATAADYQAQEIISRYVDPVSDAIKSSLVDLAFSDLAPVQSAELYASRYETLLAQAGTGAEGAVNEFTSYAKEYLDFQQTFGGDYQTVYDKVISDISGLQVQANIDVSGMAEEIKTAIIEALTAAISADGGQPVVLNIDGQQLGQMVLKTIKYDPETQLVMNEARPGYNNGGPSTPTVSI